MDYTEVFFKEQIQYMKDEIEVIEDYMKKSQPEYKDRWNEPYWELSKRLAEYQEKLEMYIASPNF
ncbi:MAG: hypothetical protein Q4D29_10645 [Lachnospiraceae bacterium]|nr:hypothetical protein [Lachnospiraceae bacterium]